MFVWARLPDGWDAAALLDRALEHDVAFVPGFPFFAGPPDTATLRLSFTTHPPAEIAEGLRRLRAAWVRLAERATSRAAAAGIGSASPIDELGRLGRLVDVADAGQPGQLAGARARVEALRVAPLALGERRRDPDLEERHAGARRGSRARRRGRRA